MKPNRTPLRGKDEGKIMKDEMKTDRATVCCGLAQLLPENSRVASIFLTHDLPSSFALAGYPVHLTASQSARFYLDALDAASLQSLQ